MRILHYNWVDYRDPAGRGGGVSQYQRVTVKALSERPGVTVRFLSSGLAHGLRPGKPRWAPTKGGPAGERGMRFHLVDAAPISPAHHSFGEHTQIDHEPTVAAFADFVAAEGPFDIIHFNNLEGLPANVLALRQSWPDTRMVVALHNYYPFCPQVNLWHRESRCCTDFDDGRACVDCLPFREEPGRMRRINAVAHSLAEVGLRPGTALHDRAVRPALRKAAAAYRHLASARRAHPRPGRDPDVSDTAAQAFVTRRATMVDHLNRHADSVLAVSDRTARLAEGFGVAPERLHVLPIGTDQATQYDVAPIPQRLPHADGTLGLTFLGYMRADKGFYFLLDALEGMPDSVLARLRLTIAAAARDAGSLARLTALSSRLAAFTYHDGYARDALGAVLQTTDLGIVPNLWEDNLPQVALEMHARRIPLLCSDRGGARELGNTPALVFRAGDAACLTERLAGILDRGLDLAPYWAAARRPQTPADHVTDLLAHYESLRGRSLVPPDGPC